MKYLKDIVSEYGKISENENSFLLVHLGPAGKVKDHVEFKTLKEVDHCTLLCPQYKLLIYSPEPAWTFGFIRKGYSWVLEPGIKCNDKPYFKLPQWKLGKGVNYA